MIKSLSFPSLLTLSLLIALFTLRFVSVSTQTVSDFSLKNVDGSYVSLKNYPDAKGFIIVFTCNHCPFAKLYPPRLNALQAKYAPLGVPLIAISSTDTLQYIGDTYEEMVKKAVNEHFTFPYLFDGEQTVAKNFAAQKTPHAFVIWKEDGKYVVRYSGAIDDNGANPEQVEQPYVADAVEALLHGNKVKVSETRSVGCQIYFRKKP